MAVDIKAGWIPAVRELDTRIDESAEVKPEIQALEQIADPGNATPEEVATAVNAIIAALKA